MALNSGGAPVDPLDAVENEILELVKDAERMTEALRDLPDKEQVAGEAASTVIERLAKIQDGLLDNINLLAEYIPFERSATQSRLKARQAKTDLEAANFSLWMIKSELDEKLPEEDEVVPPGGPRVSSGPSGRPGQDPAKRMQMM